MSSKYDIIVIGAGLSGLYSAYNIKKMFPKINLLVLESNKIVGGRIGNYNFYGEQIVIGAGVARLDTTELLIKLLKELDINYTSFVVDMHYSKQIKNVINVKEYLIKLRTIYNKYKNPPSITFKKFFVEHLGLKEYNDFVISSGYSDYANEDVYEVLYYYQMEDNASGWTALHISWSKLVSKLCEKIGYQNIITSAKVENINKLVDNSFQLTTIINQNKTKMYYSNKVIVATRISSVQKFFPRLKIYKEIHGQAFLYIYAKFDKQSSELMSKLVTTYTIVPGLLQKMIPFSKSVYMIAYCDNKNAEILQHYKENTPKNRRFFEKQVEEAVGIIPNSLKIVAIKDFYWPIGTHYYEPLDLKKYKNRIEFIKEAQHPESGILVVGEDVSRKQGWTEGALESVHAVLNKKWFSSF